MTIRDWKGRRLFRQTPKDSLNTSDGFFGVCLTTICPYSLCFMERIVITEVILACSVLLYKEGDVLEPHFSIFCDDFKVFNMSANVVVPILVVSQSHPHITIVS